MQNPLLNELKLIHCSGQHKLKKTNLKVELNYASIVVNGTQSTWLMSLSNSDG